MPKLTYPRLLTIALVFTYLLIILGGATRVYDAGMSCPDWPHCYGFYIPFPEAKIPGGYVVAGQHYTWWQVALEWSHRAFASAVGLLLIAAVVFQARAHRLHRHALLPLLVTFGLLAVQIGLGGLTVLKSNIHWSVVMHLGTAMLFFGALAWYRRAVASAGSRDSINAPTSTKLLVYIFAALVWATMLIGAFVSSSHVGGVCGGLFSCAGNWMPSPKQDLGQHIHMQHRLFATLTVVLSIVLLAVVKRTAPALRPAALHGHGMVWGQVALGIATLYSFAGYPEYYYPLSIAHLAWGTLVWLAAVGIILNLHYGRQGRFHG
ncbi:MAG: heme A synthase [Alphaproteobacteria bacterium]|nr:MAG: heme A synthase [Alphaproteobacteria bacterium]